MPDDGDPHSQATTPRGRRGRRGRRARRWLFGFVALLVLLTHVPSSLLHVMKEPRHWDKVVHFGLYATLAILVLRAFGRPRAPAATRWAAFARCAGVLLCVTAFGLLDEATQPFTGRDFDWFDWLADGMGALGGMICYEVARRRWNMLDAGGNAHSFIE